MLSKCLASIPFPQSPECRMSVSPSPNTEILKLLTVEERGQYQNLIDDISTDVQRTRRHSGLTEFVKHITLVHKFVAKGKTSDALKGIICGVEFGRGFVLVNTDRLKKVLYRSKSCMNSCFQRLGYDVMRPSHDIVCLFTRLLPNVNPEYFAIRQWCVRLVSDQCTICFVSHLPDSIASSFESHRIPVQRTQNEPETKPEPKPIVAVARKENYDFMLDIRSLLNNHTPTIGYKK